MYEATPDNIIQHPTHQDNQTQNHASLFEKIAAYGVEELHFKSDPNSGLQAIIAIHSTLLGPALGGTRCIAYDSEDAAITDVIRLARSMSYKSAFSSLAYGGGKAVLLRPQHIADTNAYFEAYGEFINTLQGRFITAVDVGTSVTDMDKIARRCKYVLSTSAGNGDPSHITAYGVLQGIKAAVKVKLQRDKLHGLRVAIQGVGKVGSQLARLLHEHGANLIISDINAQQAQQCAESCHARIVEGSKLYSSDCDVFAPCALGGCLNQASINQLNCAIVCGAANNQLAEESIGDALHRKDIFYVPDYVVNAGGLIHVVLGSNAAAKAKVAAIYDSVINIYLRSKETSNPSHRIADRMARQMLTSTHQHATLC